MKLVQSLVFASALFVTIPGFAQRGSNEWLIGHWDGTIQGFPPSEKSARVLRVHRISADGKAVALWAIPGSNAAQTETTTDGSSVKITFPGNNTVVELTREGDNSLGGKYTNPNGKTFPINSKKRNYPRILTGNGRGRRQTTQVILAIARTEPIA